MTTTQKLSLNQAAKAGKVAKTTLLNALKKGHISGDKSENGQWEINPAELGRWLDSRTQKLSKTSSENISIPRSSEPEKPPENNTVSLEVKLLRERLEDKDKTIEDLRTRLDAEAEERRQLTKQLTDQRPEPSQPPRSLWKRLVGG